VLKLLGLVVVVGCSSAQTEHAASVADVLKDPARGKDADADARRHPAELAAFAGVKPGDTVVDLIPGAGYFTRVFSLIVGPKGHVYAVWPTEYAKEDSDEVPLVQALAIDPRFTNVTMLMQPAAAFAIPAKADVVWTSQNYHDYPDKFMGPTDPALLDAAVFAALKPGGVFIVIDHVAEAGSGIRDTDTLHRIDPEVVKAQAEAAGFKLDGESDVLRNPADTHKVKVFDPSVRGRTDQFVFRFRKPA
jgi:predicted methyltransferase